VCEDAGLVIEGAGEGVQKKKEPLIKQAFGFLLTLMILYFVVSFFNAIVR